MIQPTLSHQPPDLEMPENASCTSDFEITDDARDAYAAFMVEALDRADDMVIALEIRVRDASDSGERTELNDFIREQGYDPTELGA